MNALRLRNTRLLALLVATSLGAASFVGCRERPAAPSVGRAEVIRGGAKLESGGDSETLAGPSRIDRGARVTTRGDGRVVLHLDGGAFVLLDHDTIVEPDLARVKLVKGRIFLDATRADATTVETPAGTLVLDGATASIALRGDRTEVYCGAGELTYRSPRGSDWVSQGESLVLGPGAPKVEPAEVFDDWTGGLADPAARRPGPASYVGALSARLPGVVGEAFEPLAIRAHEVRATIHGDLARTEVTQSFFNGASQDVQGEYGIRLPEGAIVTSFEVDLGTGFTASTIVPVASSGYIPVFGEDPNVAIAKLVYDGPHRVRARIQPIPPGAVVRVKLGYSEWLGRRGRVRSYVVPMESDESPPLVGELSLRVDVSDADAKSVRAGMGATVTRGVVEVRKSDARPRADFVVDLFDDGAPDELAAYRTELPRASGGTDAFVLFDVPTAPLFGEASGSADDPLDLVLVVDTSGGTETEDLELARSVVEAVLDHLAPTDRVTLRFADVTAHRGEGIPEAPEALSATLRERLLEAVARTDVGGATDLGTSLRQAASLVAGKPRGAILYLGDGVPTTGALSTTDIRAALDTIDAPPRLFALGMGDDANLDLLRAIFGEDTTRVSERTEATRVVVRLLAEAARPALRGVTVAFGPTVERVFPSGAITVDRDDALRFVARLEGELPETVEVRGTRNGQPFTHTFTVKKRSLEDGGDVARRWGLHRLGELLDANAGREAIVDVGMRFSIVSPWTQRIVGGVVDVPVALLRAFDVDPTSAAWDVGGRGAELSRSELGAPLGWRARARTEAMVTTVPESTWDPHDTSDGVAASGDGGLALAAVHRALENGARGPNGCYERRLSIRPDLQGDVTVSVQVDGSGRVLDARVEQSTLGYADVDACVLAEVRGLAFPATQGVTVRVTHVYRFAVPPHDVGIRHSCSLASERDLSTRRRLWQERLARDSGSIPAAVEVYRDAERRCELPDWSARRALVTMVLGSLPGVASKVAAYPFFASDPVLAAYVRRAILRAVRTPEDVILARNGLGLAAPVEWRVFARLWNADSSQAARLALVRRWLEVVPDDMDLRLRLLRLLEEGNVLPEARRVARALRADPLADARVRTRVAEFYLRRGETDEARRIVSELVENAPLDPWARKRLGDVYLAHGFPDDAYREYTALARLRPDDSAVLLLLARAAGAAGRTDEALRLEQRLSEASDADVDEGAAGLARWHTAVRLARMKQATNDAARRALLRARERDTGALRDPPDAFVALTWTHPDDALALRYATPTMADSESLLDAEVSGSAFGIAGFRIREREDGSYRVKIERPDREDLRESVAELVIVEHPGKPDERITVREVRLPRERPTATFTLGAAGVTP